MKQEESGISWWHLAEGLKSSLLPSTAEEHPHGSEGLATRTVLQQHVDFFQNKNYPGRIYPQDTFQGFHRIGFNWFLSFLAAVIVHFGAASLFAWQRHYS